MEFGWQTTLRFNSRANAEERKREDSGKDDAPPSNELEAKHRTEIKEDEEKKKTDPRIITKLPYRTGTEYLDDRYTHIYVMDVPQNGEKVKPSRLTDGDYNFGEIAWTKKGRRHYLDTESRSRLFSVGTYRAYSPPRRRKTQTVSLHHRARTRLLQSQSLAQRKMDRLTARDRSRIIRTHGSSRGDAVNGRGSR